MSKTESKTSADADSRPKLVLITGLSGSGKSVAANAFEDAGYYCVDNLPVTLLRIFLAEPSAHAGGRQKIAVVTDIRAPGFAEAIPDLLEEIDRSRFDFILLYLEANEEALLRRFSETRRSHPIGQGDRPVIDGIRRERDLLGPLRDAADLVFETSDWSVHDMRRSIYKEFAGEDGEAAAMVVSIVSFGFKHGPPSGADLVFDVRFLANPYFIPALRQLTGKDPEVQEYLRAQDDFHVLLEKLEDLLLFLLPRFRLENRRYLTLGIGCTGGRHRSVAVSEHLAAKLSAADWPVRLGHRDSDRR